MSTTRFVIESHLDEMELKYFCQEDGADANWILLFGEGEGLVIRLTEGGEYLLIRSLPLVKTDGMSAEHICALTKSLLKRNDSLKLGHYSADRTVVFEIGFPVEDGELTLAQMRRLLSCVANEVGSFKERLPELIKHSVSRDSIGQLIDRLIEGDHPNEAS